jgi:hypothetical protein
VPETSSPTCPSIPLCPVYRVWYAISGHKTPTMWDIVQRLDEVRQRELAKRIEWQEPQRSTIDELTKENAALRSYKRRAELFLLSKGLNLPED